jgi:hypothetical protein
MICAIVPDRRATGIRAQTQAVRIMQSRTAKAAIHGQELPGLTFHNSRFVSYTTAMASGSR